MLPLELMHEHDFLIRKINELTRCAIIKSSVSMSDKQCTAILMKNIAIKNLHPILRKNQLRQFNLRFNENTITHSIKKRFCTAAIETLKLYENTRENSIEDSINVKNLITSLSNAHSNQDIAELLKNPF